MTDFPVLSYGCCLFPLHPLYIPRSTSGGGGATAKGYTLEMFVFAIPDSNPISTQEMEIGCSCWRPRGSTFPFINFLKRIFFSTNYHFLQAHCSISCPGNILVRGCSFSCPYIVDQCRLHVSRRQ